jgi:hypothetical protein
MALIKNDFILEEETVQELEIIESENDIWLNLTMK